MAGVVFPQFIPQFKKNWGYYLFVTEIVIGIIWITWLGARGHYFNYTEPSKLLWAMEDPYHRDLPGSPGHFFYSPSCALYFFGLFAFFPSRLGQFLYMTAAIALFLWGLARLLGQLRMHRSFDIFTARYRNLLFLMVGSEAIGAIGAVKIEPLYVGALLLLASYWKERKAFLITICILGFMASWKLHPIAIVGLMLIPFLFVGDWTACLLFAFGVVLGWVSPYLVLPSAFARTVNHHWLNDLNGYMTREWKDRIFQHLPGFLYEIFGLNLGAAITNRIASLSGVAFACTFAYWYHRWRPHLLDALMVAMAAGSAYVVLFSLLMQSNSYVIYTPLVIAIVLFANRLPDHPEKNQHRQTLVILIFTYLIISIVYSDFCPRDLRNRLYDLKLKPFGVLIQLGYLVFLLKKLPKGLRTDEKFMLIGLSHNGFSKRGKVRLNVTKWIRRERVQ